MRHSQSCGSFALAAVVTVGIVVQVEAETRIVADRLEVHETALILKFETAAHMLTNESCANAKTGWKIAPESIKTEVVTARMMDPAGDPDWNVEKAEARTRIDNDGKRLCLWGYCQGPLQYRCEIQVWASWLESR